MEAGLRVGNPDDIERISGCVLIWCGGSGGGGGPGSDTGGNTYR